MLKSVPPTYIKVINTIYDYIWIIRNNNKNIDWILFYTLMQHRIKDMERVKNYDK